MPDATPSMKISHTELETCRIQPKQWLSAKLGSRQGGFRMGYERGLLLAIYSFHKQNSADDARQYLQDLVSRNHFTNAVRVSQIEAMLDLYLTWAAASHVVTVATKTRILLQVGGYLELAGEVSRVDVVGSGYRAILLKNPPPGWEGELRMPLLQDVIASKFNRPVAEVEVGFQNLDGSGLETIQFNSAQIQPARREFLRLGRRVLRFSRLIHPPPSP